MRHAEIVWYIIKNIFEIKKIISHLTLVKSISVIQSLSASWCRGDINGCYLVRGGPSSFPFFSRKNVGSRKFCGPKGKKKIFRGKYKL